MSLLYSVLKVKAQTVKLETWGGDDDILATKNELSSQQLSEF